MYIRSSLPFSITLLVFFIRWENALLAFFLGRSPGSESRPSATPNIPAIRVYMVLEFILHPISSFLHFFNVTSDEIRVIHSRTMMARGPR